MILLFLSFQYTATASIASYIVKQNVPSAIRVSEVLSLLITKIVFQWASFAVYVCILVNMYMFRAFYCLISRFLSWEPSPAMRMRALVWFCVCDMGCITIVAPSFYGCELIKCMRSTECVFAHDFLIALAMNCICQFAFFFAIAYHRSPRVQKNTCAKRVCLPDAWNCSSCRSLSNQEELLPPRSSIFSGDVYDLLNYWNFPFPHK